MAAFDEATFYKRLEVSFYRDNSYLAPDFIPDLCECVSPVSSVYVGGEAERSRVETVGGKILLCHNSWARAPPN